MESQTRPYENLRLKTKFGLVIAIFSHLGKKGKREKEIYGLVERKREGVFYFFSM